MDPGQQTDMSTPFTEHAGVEVPLICGAMYPCGNPELVAAVSDAGGLGIVQPVSFAYVHSGSLKAGLERVRELTDKPIGFNAILEKGSKRYEKVMSAWIDEALEFGVLFFVTALGNPRSVVDQVHAAGGIVYHDVTERRFAQKAIDGGVDGLIAVNRKAGGHAGKLSADILLDELRDFNVPIIAAGGIGSPETFRAKLDMGYAGVQMGTRFIATPECSVHADYRAAIVAANAEDIVLTRRLSGIDVAVIRKGTEAQMQSGEPGAILSWMLRQPKTKRWARTYLALRSVRNLKRTSRAAGETLGYRDVWQAGQSAGEVHSVESVADIVRNFREAL